MQQYNKENPHGKKQILVVNSDHDLPLMWIFCTGNTKPSLLVNILTRLDRVALENRWVVTASFALWSYNTRTKRHFTSKWKIYLMASRCHSYFIRICMWKFLSSFFFVCVCIHYLAVIFVEAQHLSWSSSKNSKWIGEELRSVLC